MKDINKIRITAARDVKIIINLILMVSVDNSPEPTKVVKQLHFSYDIPLKVNETLLVQGFPLTIQELYTDIHNGHIYRVANVYFNKQAKGIQPLEKIIKNFDKIYNDIVKGLKSK